MIIDSEIDYIRKRIWITPDNMLGVDCALGQAAETAAIVPAEMTNIGMVVWTMTDGNLINGCIRCPYDLDPKHEVGFRVAYTLNHGGSGTATALWILLQDTVAEGAAFAVPSTALNTTIANDTYITTTTDWCLNWTSRGIRNSIGLTRGQIETGAFITMKLELDAATNETSAHYIGMEMDYVPQMTIGSGRELDCPLTVDGGP